MKTWLIGDLHENVERANRILNAKPNDVHAVFVGDYLDQFHQDRTAEVCAWLLHTVHRDDVTLLIGNHDASYLSAGWLYPTPAYPCPGWTYHKQLKFDKFFPDRRVLLDRMKLTTWVGGHYDPELVGPQQGFLVSHAGLSQPLAADCYDPEVPLHPLMDVMPYVEKSLRQRKVHTWLEVGQDRGGNNVVGGITWCDWDYLSPLPGIAQIVGHTPGWQIRHRDHGGLTDYCIDTFTPEIAVVDEQGEIEFIKL